jgi:hypothetical protein
MRQALFLPTRNAAVRCWAAFNSEWCTRARLTIVAAPHHFLKLTDAMEAQITADTREWIIARIVQTEEAVASGQVGNHTMKLTVVCSHEPFWTGGWTEILYASCGRVQP